MIFSYFYPNMITKNLLYPPIKTVKNIPKRLIYPKIDTYTMFSTDSFQVLGRMRANPMKMVDNSFYRRIPKYTMSLYINQLDAFVKNSKVGTDFINFAKRLSHQKNCSGRVHVIAYNADKPSQPPHKFYKKMGFAANSPMEDSLLEEAVQNNTDIPINMHYGTSMFLKQ